MSRDFVLGGYLIGVDGVRNQLPIVSNPSCSIVDDVVKRVVSLGKGVVVLRYKSIPENGPYELELHVDSGRFLLILNVNDEDGGHSVRTPTSKGGEGGYAIVLGGEYPASAVVHNVDFVCSVFNEFLLVGNVSMEFLD